MTFGKIALALVCLAFTSGRAFAQKNTPVTVDDRLLSLEKRVTELEKKVSPVVGKSGGPKCLVCGEECECKNCGCGAKTSPVQKVSAGSPTIVTDSYGNKWTVSGCETGQCKWTQLSSSPSPVGSTVSESCSSGNCGTMSATARQGYSAAKSERWYPGKNLPQNKR